MADTLAIQIQVAAGDAAGRTLRLSGPVVTIGRDGGCDVVIDLPFVSRVQCELRAEGGQWNLVNCSSHGTRLSRKLVKDKPRTIRPGDTVRVGDESIVQLAPIASQAPAPTSPGPASEPAEVKDSSGRTKLWTGIGIYGVIMLGLIIFFATLDKQTTPPDPLAALIALTDEQIHDEIHHALSKRSLQPHRMTEQLQRARELFAMRQSSPDALYQAHEAYKVALSYGEQDTFPDPLDQRRFQLAQDQLIEQVTLSYRAGTNQLRSRQFDQAVRQFARLAAQYPAGRDSAIYRSCQQQRATAKKELAKR